MPKIVSNTTPIISLLKLGRLDLLHKLYSQIYIPAAVYKEIEAEKQNIKAKAKGFIKELKPLLDELTNKNVWISDKLKIEILKRVDEE